MAASNQPEIEDEDAPAYAEHSGDGPPHHHHRPHHHHEHHRHHHDHHHTHRDMGDPNEVGSCAWALRVMTSAAKALPDQKSRHLVIGHLIGRLSESAHISGTSPILVEMVNTTNRYQYVPDSRDI